MRMRSIVVALLTDAILDLIGGSSAQVRQIEAAGPSSVSLTFSESSQLLVRFDSTRNISVGLNSRRRNQ